MTGTRPASLGASLWPPVLRPAAFAASAALALAPTALAAQVPPRAADTELAGTITRADFQTYRRVPFAVPDKVDRLVVAFDYDGREQRTVIDLAVEDQHGLRGASGGNKASFTIAPSDATPSYLPGRIEPGQWALSLAVPNIRPGVTAHWKAKVWFLKGAEAENLPGPTGGRGPGWYRGDLHMHSAHSDGSCPSQAARSVPCPLFRTLERAAAAKLDFVAVTEHNTTSHAQVLREAQPFFDRMLLIPGREVTTFFGHFNVFGVTTPIDYKIMPDGPASGGKPSFNQIADQVHALGGMVSINHPALPSGEICMGCGWTMPAADYAKVDAVEIVNGSSVGQAGGDAESAVSGAPFWLARLRDGHAVAAIGGSDNHAPDSNSQPGALGHPVTVVHAEDLTQSAILAGLRSGRSFIALDPALAPLHLDFTVRAGTRSAAMGGSLIAPRGQPVSVALDIAGPGGATLELLDGEAILARVPIADAAAGKPRPLALALARGPHLIRIQLRGADGRIAAFGNAVRVKVE